MEVRDRRSISRRQKIGSMCLPEGYRKGHIEKGTRAWGQLMAGTVPLVSGFDEVLRVFCRSQPLINLDGSFARGALWFR